jgi:flagellar biosynthesis protein
MSAQKVAVALKYDAPTAPRVTAIGRGELAQRIIETAEANGVPLTDNPALAEALSKIPLDQEIPESLYRAVAEVLSYILRTSGQLR